MKEQQSQRLQPRHSEHLPDAGPQPGHQDQPYAGSAVRRVLEMRRPRREQCTPGYRGTGLREGRLPEVGGPTGES